MGDQPIRWEEMVSRIQAGDPSAEEELGSFFRARVMALAMVRLRDPELAEEVAQETLLAVLKALRDSSVREPEKLPGFVYGTARNLVNNHLRSMSQRPNHVPLDFEGVSSSDVAQEAEWEEQRRVVRAALDEMKPLDRKILLLTLVEGLHPREIAPQVGLSAENVRTRKARAIRALIAEMKKLSRK